MLCVESERFLLLGPVRVSLGIDGLPAEPPPTEMAL